MGTIAAILAILMIFSFAVGLPIAWVVSIVLKKKQQKALYQKARIFR